MSRTVIILIGAVIGFVIQASRHIADVPPGASLDLPVMLGSSLAGALMGVLGGAVIAVLVLRKK
jgi:uncharacterized membrane protein